MTLTDELQKLQKLHDEGALTADEFARAKSAILPPGPGEGGAVELRPADVGISDQHLPTIQLQNEVAQLDREWELERKNYLGTGKGGEYIPTEGAGIVGALVVGVFGTAWTIGAASMGAPAIFPLFGIVFVLLGVGSCLNDVGKAGKYREAETRYKQRRAELIAQGDSYSR